MNITVIGNQLPTVSLTAPTSGTPFTAPTDITLTATAADSDGSVVKVEFFAGTTLLATLSAAPYTTVWKNPLPGSYTLTARATDNRGATTTSTAASITVGGTAVRITAPADGTALAAPAEITLQVSAVTASGNSLTRLEIFDGASLLRTFDVSGNSINLNYGLLDVEAGSHVYTVKATLNTGAVVTSAPVTVNVLIAAAVTLTTLSNFYLAPAAIDLYANVTPAANTTIAKVEFFSNGTNLIGTVTAAPYNFRWANVASGSYTVTAKVTDSRGLVVTSNSRSIAVSASPPASLTITSPANQASLTAESIAVTGSYQAVPNAGIVVNGVIATLDDAGNFFAVIPLTQGSNTITATLTAPTAETAVSTVNVTTMSANLPGSVTVDTTNGPAPLDVVFTLSNSGSVPLTFALNGGTPFTLVEGGTATLPTSYTQPGAFISTFVITDGMGQSTTKTLLVEVRNDVITDLMLRAIWNNMGDKLRAGDVSGAMGFITGGGADQYATLFNALKLEGKLANAVDTLGALRGSTVGSDIAEMIISRETANGTVAYPVWLLRGPDGVWRIESM